MSKLQRKSARRGEGRSKADDRPAAGLPWTTMAAGLARFYLRCSSERPRRANLAYHRHDAFIVQYGRKTARFDVISPSHPEAPRSMSNYDITRNNLDNPFGVTDKLCSLVTEIKSELQTELIRLRL